MGIFSFFGNMLRRKTPVRQQRAPQDLTVEEARSNKAVNNPRHPAVIISPELNKKIQAQIRAKESQQAAVRGRRAQRFNVRR